MTMMSGDHICVHLWKLSGKANFVDPPVIDPSVFTIKRRDVFFKYKLVPMKIFLEEITMAFKKKHILQFHKQLVIHSTSKVVSYFGIHVKLTKMSESTTRVEISYTEVGGNQPTTEE